MVRQLTAIMFTDMAGYTALMQQDERLAKASRDRQRQVIVSRSAEHGGRILQYYGDGTLSVFRSAIDAVRCAVEIQEGLRAAPAVPLRIGLHTGDVVHDEEGVFGDGVNVAARIQGMSVAGGILISGKVFDEVKNHPEIRTRSLGSFNLKHVQHPMNVFAVVNDGLSVPSETDVGLARVSTAKSVAVLPFVNMSADPENEYFSDGITEDVINALTRVNGLKVTARTSSFAFKNRNEDIRHIAERLAVSHVLEGSVRRAGNRVRVTAQLICAADGYHVFSESYDRSLDDVFAVQDEIATTIVGRLADHLRPMRTSEQERPIAAPHSHDTDAHVEYLKGRFEWAHFTPLGARRAISHYERSIALDPACALPHSGMATAYAFLGALGQLKAADAFSRAEAAALRALELEPDAAQSHVALASVKLFFHWDFEGAYRSLQKALTLTPGSAETHYIYGLCLQAMGEHEESIEVMRTAVQLDPLSAVCNDGLAHCLAAAGRVAEARDQIDRTLAVHPHFRSAMESLGWIHVLETNYDAAVTAFEKFSAAAGNEWAGAGDRGYAYAKAGRTDDAQRMLHLLESRSLLQPDVTLDMDFAIVHEALGNRDVALGHLSRAVERRMGSVVLLGSFAAFKGARTDPRFRAILDSVGLPVTM
jgi:TolB-like protein/class 3 adenylate cyclase/Tfp pilus assembly protein PilF